MNKEYPTFLDKNIELINLELTNRCMLKCSECSRTKIEDNKYIHDLSKPQNISIDLIKKIFTKESFPTPENIEIQLSGNYGDPIYHPQFHEILAYLKTQNFKLHIETNGSYKDQEWWEKTCEYLDRNDLLTFSIDGLEDTNHLYRKSSDWKSIMIGLKTCAPRVNIEWKFIVFSHNEHQIQAAKIIAKDLGVKIFSINKSGRFKKNDPLKPQNPDWLGLKAKNKSIIREKLRTRNKLINFFKSSSDIKVLPRCKTGRSLFISCDGYLFPCCAARDLTKKSWFYSKYQDWSLDQKTFAQILGLPIWKELERLFDNKSCPEVCKRYCGVTNEFQKDFNNNPRKIDQNGVDTLSWELK